MLTAKNVLKHLRANKKLLKYKKTPPHGPALKHNGTGLIKEHEASYIRTDKQIIVSKASYPNA